MLGENDINGNSFVVEFMLGKEEKIAGNFKAKN